MSASLTELPLAPAWQALLALSPALIAALAALLAMRGDAATAWRTARAASAAMLAAALLSLGALAITGPGQAVGIRIDAVGGIVGLLVAFIAAVIVRYSRPYLSGASGPRCVLGEAGYARWLLATVAAVLLVVVANHLLLLAAAWTATSLALHRLLTFFNDRPAARAAAHKKYVISRVADAAMLAACALLAAEFGTLRIDALLAQAAAADALPALAQAATLLVVVAAVLKCAQLPFHGWLIQVMEAPTPVSALLHAGVVNLGGFVLIRLAPLVAEVPLAAGVLVVAGAFTAVVAAMVMTTRISIKVALAWSTCAQMGFMLLQCGLGLWQMALLHLVAHSLYKAHAFLGAGGVVRQWQVRQLAPVQAPAGLAARLAAGTGVLALLGGLALLWPTLGQGAGMPAQPALWLMAAIVALALTPMLLAGPAMVSGAVVLRTAVAAVLLAALWWGLHALLSWRMPAAAPAAIAWPLLAAVAAAFAGLFVLQSIVSARPQGAVARSLYPWFYGGLFLDELFSRAVFRLWPPPPGQPVRTSPPHAA